MTEIYGRDLDLNLLRVFVVVAEAGSVTAAASRLYLTQPAVSAALRRLTEAMSVPLFVRHGRGLVLTARGQRLLAAARPHLEALVGAALADETFDLARSDRTVRIGLSDANETSMLPPLLRTMAKEAPHMKLVVVPVQFRTVGEALATARIDLAVTVADELPAGTERRPLYRGGFMCLFDPRHVRFGSRITKEHYLAEEHVVVSYNGDLRGIVEDTFKVQRRIRVSVPSFHSIGAIVEGSSLVATIPEVVAHSILTTRPRLRALPSPFTGTGTMELVWRSAVNDDGAFRFVRDAVVRIAEDLFSSSRAAKASSRRR